MHITRHQQSKQVRLSPTFACIKKRGVEKGERGRGREKEGGRRERSLPKDLFYDFHAAWQLGTSPTFKISNYVHEIFVDVYLVSCLRPSGS